MTFTFARRSRRVGVTAVAALAVAALGGAGVGYAASATATPTAQPAIQTITPRSERDVTNIDVLRQRLRADLV